MEEPSRWSQSCYRSDCHFCVFVKKQTQGELPSSLYTFVSQCLKEQHFFRLSEALWKDIQEIDPKHKPFYLCSCSTLYEAVHQPPLQLVTFETFLKLYQETNTRVQRDQEEEEDKKQTDSILESIHTFFNHQSGEDKDRFLVVVLIRQEENPHFCFSSVFGLHRFAEKQWIRSHRQQNLPLPPKASLQQLQLHTQHVKSQK